MLHTSGKVMGLNTGKFFPFDFFFLCYLWVRYFVIDGFLVKDEASSFTRPEEEIMENFWTDEEDNGTYLTVKLKSEKSIKEKCWLWIQQCIRGILGGKDKVANASFLSDVGLLVKTKYTLQEGIVLWR